MITGIESTYIPTKDRQDGILHTKKSSNAKSVGDRVSLHAESLTLVTYTPTQAVQGPCAEFSDLRELVARLLLHQGKTSEDAVDKKSITQEEAQQLIAEDGYWGIEKTSDRIVQFAIAAAGNDPGRLDAIKAGIEKGFSMAADAFGGTLPEISFKTHDAIMDKLDAWAASLG